MKLQLFLLSVLLVSAFAHPVPDEEVSPVKSEVKSDVKPEVVEKPVKKLVESVKPDSRATEELKKPAEEPIKEKILLSENAPDAEIAQTIPEKKEEKIPLVGTEKQTRAENKPVVVAKSSGDVKSLPVVEVPVAGVEAEKPNVAEEKPSVAQVIAPKQISQEGVVQPEGKVADLAAASAPATAAIPIAEAPASEQKKDELSAIETAPAVKSDIPAPAAPVAIEQPAEKPIAIAEEKKEEQPTRQERGSEQEAAAKPVEAQPAAEAQAAEAEIKTLKVEEPKPAAAAPSLALAIEQPVKVAENDLKSLPVEKPIETTPAAPAGDIPAAKPFAPAAPIAAAAEESNLKDLKPAEPKQEEKQEEPLVLAAAPAAAAPLPEAKQIVTEPVLAAAAPAAEQQAFKQAEQPAVAPMNKLEELPAAVPLADKKLDEKKLDEKKALSEEKKSEESKESKESESESKESGESKEDKSK